MDMWPGRGPIELEASIPLAMSQDPELARRLVEFGPGPDDVDDEVGPVRADVDRAWTISGGEFSHEDRARNVAVNWIPHRSVSTERAVS